MCHIRATFLQHARQPRCNKCAASDAHAMLHVAILNIPIGSEWPQALAAGGAMGHTADEA